MVERSKCMNVPEIRFKEFCDYYSDILLEKCLSVSNKKNNKLEYKKEDALSVSDEFGVVNQIEHLGRSYTGWKSHSTLTLLATQNYPFLLKYDCPLWLK